MLDVEPVHHRGRSNQHTKKASMTLGTATIHGTVAFSLKSKKSCPDPDYQHAWSHTFGKRVLSQKSSFGFHQWCPKLNFSGSLRYWETARNQEQKTQQGGQKNQDQSSWVEQLLRGGCNPCCWGKKTEWEEEGEEQSCRFSKEAENFQSPPNQKTFQLKELRWKICHWQQGQVEH